MWTADPTTPGRWTRDDGDGYLLADGDLMLELHGDTMHVYRKDSTLDPAMFVGSPLDGYAWQSTEPAPKSQPVAAPDATTAFQLLADQASAINADQTAPAAA